MKYVIGTLIIVALAGAACSTGGGDSTLPIFPAPTPPSTTETFTGTVAVGSGDIHSFNAAAGALTVTMTEAGPPPTILMGLGVGVPSDTSCVFFDGAAFSAQAAQTAQISGTLSSGGPVCVEVFDIGNQTSPVTYSVTVVHL